MNVRCRQLTQLLHTKNVDAFLVTKDINITYLTKFHASESWLIVTSRDVFYLTDSRYILEAQKGLKRAAVVKEYKKSMSDGLLELAALHNFKKLGFDPNHLTLAQYLTLKKKCGKRVQLVAIPFLVESLREIKDKEEIGAIRKALDIHQEALKFMKRQMKPGKSERELLEILERFVKSRNAAFSFSPIIASGPNSCFPHARITDRKIKNDDVVLLDTGILYKGYMSDLTRMFFFGRIPPFLRETYEIVRVAQRRAIAEIRANVPVAQADRAARGYLGQFKLDKFFGHALGHGVGLEIHESPRLSQTNEAVFREGMVVTVEPAVYLPGKFGIRYEDMVLVKKGKSEVISDID